MNATAPGWYCVRSHPKHEHIAAASLRQIREVKVFFPKIRLRKATRRGPVWFTDPLFPGYLFARFSLSTLLPQLQHAFGVSGVVHFGSQWPVIPEVVINELYEHLGGQELHLIEPALRPGEEITIAAGPFSGLSAVVSRYLPSRQRVQVLLDFLGQSPTIELDIEQVVIADRHPENLRV